MTQLSLFDRRSVLVSALFAVLTAAVMGAMAICVFADKNLQKAYELSRTFLTISDQYTGRLDYERLISSARQAMFRNLDRYSNYIPAEDFERMREELSGGYSGIGVTVIRHDQGLMVMGVNASGPAHKAGLLLGDIITATDSLELSGLNGDSAIGILRGEEGESVQVEVFRPSDNDTFTVNIVRGEVPLVHVPYAGITPDNLIYIRLVDFEAGASDDVANALDSLLKKQDRPPWGVILDLRGNPGGLFSEAYHTANIFLEGRQFIVGTDARSRWNEEKHFSSGEDMTGGLPMAVLVDERSASSAEITAGSLGQLNRAVLVGDTTFGKGLVQGFTHFFDGSGLRLTISRYYLEGGVYLNAFDSALHDTGSGLPPDFVRDFDDRREFNRRMENSLLLHNFAAVNQDEIIRQSTDQPLDETWLQRFADFADDEGFIYESSKTRLAQYVAEAAYIESRSPKMVDLAGNLVGLAQKDDMDQIYRFGPHILMRIKQLAWERKHGLYQSYAQVVVDRLPEIEYATAILKDSIR